MTSAPINLSFIYWLYAIIFSCGSNAVMVIEFNSIPRKTIMLQGQKVLCGAVGILISQHKARNFLRYSPHISLFPAMKRKSSITLTRFFTLNFVFKIHAIAVENFSKMLQDEEHPCGRHLSK